MTDDGVLLRGRGVVPGVATGRALVSPVMLSFLGDLDIATGRIVSADSPIGGQSLTGRVLVIPESVGSAGSWRFLYQLFVHGTHPVGIVIDADVDPSLLQGALLAGIPVLCRTDTSAVVAVRCGEQVTLDADMGVLRTG